MIMCVALVNSVEERDKLGEIYIKYKKLMYSIAYDILNDIHEAEDVVQYTIIKMAHYIEKIDDVNSNKTKHLILTIVKNIAIDIYRKRKRNLVIDIDELSDTLESNEVPLDDLVIRLGEAKELSEKLAKLKNEYADILTLRYYHQFDNEEIADIINITNENVRIRIYRAKNCLKKLMTNESQYDGIQQGGIIWKTTIQRKISLKNFINT